MLKTLLKTLVGFTLVAALGGKLCSAEESTFDKSIRYSMLLQNEVQARLQMHQSLLNETYAAFLPRISAENPSKAGELKAVFNLKEIRGYQNLPRIVPSNAESAGTTPTPRYYDWQLCKDILDVDHPKLITLADQLGSTASSIDLIPFADLLIALKRSSITLGRHASYNEVWQGHIANPQWRSFFDRNTAIFTAIEQGCDTKLPYCGISDPTLVNQIVFNQQLQNRLGSLKKTSSDDAVVIELEVTTDITDETFLKTFQATISKFWVGKLQETEIRVSPYFKKVSPAELYTPGSAPPNGSALDLATHLGKFKNYPAVLTTGAASTYCTTDHICVLGPQELSDKTLAHEFGHLLGFQDCYYRGYRARGHRGLQVLEIESDFRDIMCSIGTGTVLPSHLIQLLNSSS